MRVGVRLRVRLSVSVSVSVSVGVGVGAGGWVTWRDEKSESALGDARPASASSNGPCSPGWPRRERAKARSATSTGLALMHSPELARAADRGGSSCVGW